MTDLITADTHWSDNPRDSYRLDFLHETLPQLIKQHKVDRLIHLGDLTEEEDHHSAWLVNNIVEGLAALAEEVEIIILRGNHDYQSIDNPFFKFLRSVQCARFIDKPDLSGWLDTIAFLPHSRDYKRDWKGLNFKGMRLVYTHNTFAGADGGYGRKLEGIPLDALPDIPIISGDVHVPQKLKNLTYVGAPYRVDFGDDFEPRVLLLDGTKMTSTPVPGPQKRLIEIKNGACPAPAVANKGDILKVRCTISNEYKAKWSQIKDFVRKWGEDHEFIIHTVQPIFEASAPIQGMMRKAERKSDKQVLQEFAKSQKLDTLTTKVGLNLLNET